MPLPAQIRCIIVDDERDARRNLRRLLVSLDGRIAVSGEAADGEEAVKKIKDLAPDLVFLDIHLPKFDGFQVLEQLPKPYPYIIFTTAFDKYAVKAFDVNSIDYLLKPVSSDRLAKAIERLATTRARDLPDARLIHQAIREMEKVRVKRIQVKVGGVISFVNIADISHFQGEDYLTAVHALGRKYLIESPLYELEVRLPSSEFVRIHRSTIVNISHVNELRKSFGGRLMAVLKQPPHQQLTISRMYARRINELFQCI